MQTIICIKLLLRLFCSFSLQIASLPLECNSHEGLLDWVRQGQKGKVSTTRSSACFEPLFVLTQKEAKKSRLPGKSLNATVSRTVAAQAVRFAHFRTALGVFHLASLRFCQKVVQFLPYPVNYTSASFMKGWFSKWSFSETGKLPKDWGR